MPINFFNARVKSVKKSVLVILYSGVSFLWQLDNGDLVGNESEEIYKERLYNVGPRTR